MSDRIAIMANGRIQQLGRPSDIYMRPETSFVAGFFGESNFIAVTVEGRGQQIVVRPEALTETRLQATSRGPLNGKRSVAMIRPEAINIGDTPDPAVENHLAGTVEWCDFLGASLRLTVRTGAGLITIRKSRLASAAGRDPGTPVWLSWRADETMVFDAGS
jgi:putative spermidine/putrescine transport system ATP-binding protein